MFLCNVQLSGFQYDAFLLCTKIMAASWILVDIVGAIIPYNFWPLFSFALKKKKKERKKKQNKKKKQTCFKMERGFHFSFSQHEYQVKIFVGQSQFLFSQVQATAESKNHKKLSSFF